MNGFGLHVIPMVGFISCLGWVCVRLVWKGERPRLRQDGPRDAHSPRLSFLEAKALKRVDFTELHCHEYCHANRSD